MPTGFPIDNMADGTGAEPQDLQAIIAARYQSAGTLEGAVVTGQADWRYHVSNGAVVVDLAPDAAAEVPVFAQYLTPDPAPATGDRLDTIYVHQRLVDVHGDNLAVVAVTTAEAPTVPDGAVVLDKRRVPAGATATSSTSSEHDRAYAIPAGATLGSLGYKAEADDTPHATELVTGGNLRTKAVPTDRWLDVQFTGTMSLSDVNGATPDTNLRLSVLVKLYIDGDVRKSFELPVDRLWSSVQVATTERVGPGAHTAHFTVQRKWVDPALPTGERYWAVRAGGTDQYRGNTLAIIDRGVAK